MRRVSLALGLSLLVAATTAIAGLPVIVHEGRPYIELDRLAQTLGATVETGSVKASLRTPRNVVTLTRNWSQIVVDGRPLVLDDPVRVKGGAWLVPESFLERVLPRLTPAPLAKTAPPTRLDELRVRSYPSFTRVVIETASPLAYRIESSAGKEARVRLLGLGGEPRTESLDDGFVDEVRLDRAGADGILRVIFAGKPGELKTSTLSDPPRLVLDFHRPGGDAPGERADRATPLRLIVLDAGHGGHDTGATGPTGLAEKDLVLDVTRRVAKLVESDLGVRVLLTRSDDTFIALRDRTSIANRERGDLFVSIHANAHRQIDSAGVETYFLSSEATDSNARQAAAVENSVVQLENPAGGRGRDIVKAILWDLAQSTFQVESSRLAEIVQDSMTRSLRIPNRGVKQAGFYVLGGAAMPAVLVEIGFVTNPREEKRLKDSRYRDEIARAILSGLGDYKRTWDARARAAERTR